MFNNYKGGGSRTLLCLDIATILYKIGYKNRIFSELRISTYISFQLYSFLVYFLCCSLYLCLEVFEAQVVQSIYEKYLANPPQIATEAIPTVLCSEQPPESQKKSLGKSKWWNIVKIIYN